MSDPWMPGWSLSRRFSHPIEQAPHHQWLFTGTAGGRKTSHFHTHFITVWERSQWVGDYGVRYKFLRHHGQDMV